MNEEEARHLMAGEFGVQLSKYPLRFCKPAFFGARPAHGDPLEVNNGTASLIRRGDEHFAITCAHVLEGFRRKKEAAAGTFFNIGNCSVDPVGQLVRQDEDLDVAVVGLTPAQADEIVHGSDGIGEAFFDMGVARPSPVAGGEGLAFGGFPGALRRVQSLDALNFGGYGCGATPVTAAHDDYLVCRFEREEWVRNGYEPEPDSIGGISGGPAFRLLQSAAGVISYEFCGIVREYSETLDLLYFAQASAIHDLMGWG